MTNTTPKKTPLNYHHLVDRKGSEKELKIILIIVLSHEKEFLAPTSWSLSYLG